jgi:hypothetical protein
MKPDPILDELWKVKDRLAEDAGNDPKKFIENLKRWETENTQWIPQAWHIAPSSS